MSDIRKFDPVKDSGIDWEKEAKAAERLESKSIIATDHSYFPPLPAPPKPPRDSFSPGPRQQLTRATLDPEAPPPTAETPPDPGKWSYSSTRRLAQWILGRKNVLPQFVRVWHRPNEPVQIGMQRGAKKIVLGQGATFQLAFENTFLQGLKEKDEALEEELARPKPPRDSETP